MTNEREAAAIPRRVILALLLGGLFVLGYLVLSWFILPAVWAAILAYATWPVYVRLRKLLRGHAMSSAVVMTLLLTTAFVLPLLWLIALLQGEFVLAYKALTAYLAEGPHRLPDFVLNLPWVGERLQNFIGQLSADHRTILDLVYYQERSVSEVAAILDIPEATVKTRMFYARKKLSELLARHGVDRGWP